MACCEKDFTSWKLTDYTFPQFETYLQKSPALILPVGGIEPVGTSLSLGTINEVCERICHALGKQLSVVSAPLLTYGASVPFKSFGGSAGVHPGILVNFVTDCCKCWFFHGIKRIMIVTLSMDATRWGAEVVRRLSAVYGASAVGMIALQSHERFTGLCREHGNGDVTAGRNEWGIAALAAWLGRSSGDQLLSGEKRGSREESLRQFKQWFRRGRDPEKLRKLFPDAWFGAENLPFPSETDGKMLFDALLRSLVEEMTPFFA